MKMFVLKAFPYAHDHHTVRTLQEGQVVEIDDGVVEGLEAEDFVREPTAAELEAADEGPVVIEAPVEIPADWAGLGAAASVKLARALGAGAGVKTKADAQAFVAAEVARRDPADA